ncbi:unnamed protein product [Prunus armeniaca]|uniref:Uncharacterized protein n=1 Tax=Prunus armeniaca TaxID=36596 RepID=A0A6J5VH52_PRUAR|nr:unnamed protein product [Prunus armeniaca]
MPSPSVDDWCIMTRTKKLSFVTDRRRFFGCPTSRSVIVFPIGILGTKQRGCCVAEGDSRCVSDVGLHIVSAMKMPIGKVDC